MSVDWNNADTVEKLKELWLDGYSAGQIAKALGGTRSQMIGKIYRLGLTKTRETKVRHFNNKPKQPQHKIFVPKIVENLGPEPIGPLNDFPEIGLCRFIQRHPAIQDWKCCGHEGLVKEIKGKKITLAFCEYHWKLTHRVKPPPAVDENSNPVPKEDLPYPQLIGWEIKKGSKLAGLRKRSA